MIVPSVRVGAGGHPVDLVVEGGVITELRPSAEPERAVRVVLPGLVDLHTHLREPGGNGSETIASGTRAAAAGGYTDVFAMANTDPVTDTAERYAYLAGLAQGASARVHPVAAATIGRGGETVVDVEALAAEGATLFSDDGSCVWDDDAVTTLMQRIAAVGAVFAQHAQDPRIVGAGVINERVADRAGAAPWPVAGEEAIVARDIEVVRRTEAALHVCHVSTAGSVALVRQAKAEGLPMTAEVTPHHLVLTDDDAVREGPALKVNPPLRAPSDAQVLRAALADGTIDAVATDHAPHLAEQKARPWATAAFGLTAIETALPIVIEVLQDGGGHVDWDRVAEVMSVAPARIGRIADVAGRPVAVGEPATFCVVELGGQWPVHGSDQVSLSDNTPFEGRVVTSRVVLTVLDGRVTHRA